MKRNKKKAVKNFKSKDIMGLIDKLNFIRELLIDDCNDNNEDPNENEKILNLQNTVIKIMSSEPLGDSDIKIINDLLSEFIISLETAINDIVSGKYKAENYVINSIKIDINKTKYLKNTFNSCVKLTNQ